MTKGSMASTIILSPTLAPPSRITASRAARAARGMVSSPAGSSSPSTAPMAVSTAPHNAPEVPPACSDHAEPAALRVVAAPAPSPLTRRASARAARDPRAMPIPWSPSPATESRRPNSLLRSDNLVATTSRASTITPARLREAQDPGLATMTRSTSWGSGVVSKST